MVCTDHLQWVISNHPNHGNRCRKADYSHGIWATLQDKPTIWTPEENRLQSLKKGRKKNLNLASPIKIPIVQENVNIVKWVLDVRTSVKNWLYFEILVPEMRCRGRSISTRAHRNNTMVAKPSSKKSWQHQLITKHLAANAGCVSGW